MSLRTSSSQCHSNPVLVPPNKPLDPVKDLYGGKTYHLKTRVNICTRMDVVPVKYGKIAQTFQLTIWFFQFITGVTFKWDYFLWRIIYLLVWIGVWIKLKIFRVPPYPVIWYFQGFGSLCRAFMMSWIISSKNDLKVSHRKKVNNPSNMKLVTYLMTC